MTHLQYILTCLIEELGEAALEITTISEVVLKGDGIQADYSEVFKDFITEINDVTACVELLIDHGVLSKQRFEEQDLEQTTDLLLFDNSAPVSSKLIAKHLNAQKAVSKMIRFGIGHTHPVFGVPGTAVVTNCLLDLFANVRSLRTKHRLEGLYDPEAIKAKKQKVYKYLNMSVAEGRVNAFEVSEKQ